MEKHELESAIGDKNGKMFAKLDVDKNGSVDPQEFLSYFENMSKGRGRKAAEGLLSFVQKGIDKLKKEKAEAAMKAAAEEAEEEGADSDDAE